MQPTGSGTYTPPGGLTPQAQATTGLQSALSAVQQLSQQAGVDPSSAVQSTFNNAANAQLPAQTQQVNAQLTQQSGIPNLQNQQNNLGQIFSMYLADQNLSQKYSSPTLNSPNSLVYNSGLQNKSQPITGLFSGYQNQGTNPYLASPTDIINALSQPQGQGFQGFVSPSQDTSAIGVVPSSAQGLISMLGGDVSTEQGIVNQKLGDYQTGYQNIMGQLGNLLGNQAEASFQQSAPGTPAANQKLESSIQQDVKNGMTLQQVLLKYRAQTDPNSIYGIYNTIHATDKVGSKGSSGWGTAKESADQLASMGITGAPVTQAANAQKTSYQAKKLPNGDLANYDPKTGKYYDPNTGKQLNISSSEMQAAQSTANIAQKMMDSYQNMNPIERAALAIPGTSGLISHISPDYAAAQSQLYQSLGDLRKGSIGGRITQQEITWLTQKLFPSPLDTQATMKAKVTQLDSKVQQLASDPNSHVNPDGSISGGSGGGNKSMTVGQYQVSY